jgi:hypothetical protein
VTIVGMGDAHNIPQQQLRTRQPQERSMMMMCRGTPAANPRGGPCLLQSMWEGEGNMASSQLAPTRPPLHR